MSNAKFLFVIFLFKDDQINYQFCYPLVMYLNLTYIQTPQNVCKEYQRIIFSFTGISDEKHLH